MQARKSRNPWATSAWFLLGIAGRAVSFETQLGTLSHMKTNHKSALTTGQQGKATSDAMVSRGKTALANKSLDDLDQARTAASKDQTDVTSWSHARGQIVFDLD
jgi:hypothetical protein